MELLFLSMIFSLVTFLFSLNFGKVTDRLKESQACEPIVHMHRQAKKERNILMDIILN